MRSTAAETRVPIFLVTVFLAFAYPYGDHDDETVEIVGDAGFEIACTTRACSTSARSQMLRMPRVAVGAWNASELSAAISSVNPE